MKKYYRYIILIGTLICILLNVGILKDNSSRFNIDLKNPSQYRKPIIALLDTGCNVNDSSVIWVNKNEIVNNIDDDLNGYVDDINGWNFIDNSANVSSDKLDTHGNCMLNIIKSEFVDIMILKVLAEDETGCVENIIKAIEYAEDNGATICNLSFITYENSNELKQVMKNSSMLFVVSAGNMGEDLNMSADTFPVCYELENMITVAACDVKGNIITDSNYGNKYVDIATIGDMVEINLSNTKSVLLSGTSVSAAKVTNIIAILDACSYEKRNASQLKELICSLVHKDNNCKKKVKYEGIIDLNYIANE